MFAIIRSGSRQYRVEEGTVLELERLTVGEGGKIEFSEVLLFADGDDIRVGRPHVEGVTVVGELVEEFKAPKVIAVRYKAKKDVHKRRGHRQQLMRVRITALGKGTSRKTPAKRAATPAKSAS